MSIQRIVVECKNVQTQRSEANGKKTVRENVTLEIVPDVAPGNSTPPISGSVSIAITDDSFAGRFEVGKQYRLDITDPSLPVAAVPTDG